MPRALYRLGGLCARRPLLVLLAWIVVAGAAIVGNAFAGGDVADEFEVPGTESQDAADLLTRADSPFEGGRARVVFAVERGSVAEPPASRAVAEAVRALQQVQGVALVVDPLGDLGTVSADGRVAVGEILFTRPAVEVGARGAERLEQAVEPLRGGPVQIELGGEVLALAAQDEPTGRSEAIGIAAAVVILLIAFGSVVAMGLPVLDALVGLAVAIPSTFLLAHVVPVNTVAPILVAMIGIAVGIDYSLFVLTRHRQHLAEGLEVEDAIARATATAGQAVVFAGGTVVISILGLAIVGIPFVTALGVVTAAAVAIAVLIAITLLPATLGLLGRSVDRLRVPGLRIRHETERGEGWAGRWAGGIARHPLAAFLLGAIVVVALALPLPSLRLGFADAGAAPEGSTRRQAYDLVAESLGPGFNGPLLLVVDASGADVPASEVAGTLAGRVAELPGVVEAAPVPTPGDAPLAVVTAVPTTGPAARATEALVERVRDGVVAELEQATGATVLVGGPTAALIDVTERLRNRLVPFIAVVLGLSMVLLTMVFRAPVVALKAALLNVLSIAAAYGVVVAVFQWGWGNGLVGVDEPIPIAPFIPMMMFAILFGLSMDYEVFILSRIRERWLDHGDAQRSVVEGLAATARVVTAAASIMVVVFASFVLQDETVIKVFGVGLATAILVDATLVRLVLVPSMMELLGKANWWLPTWLDRALPPIDVEGESGLPARRHT